MANIGLPQVGKLRHRITVQRGTVTIDEYQQPQETIEDIGTYWAQVIPLSGKELVNAKQIKPTTSHQVYMRQNVPVIATDRLLFEGRYLGIDQINRMGERNEWYSIMCTEISEVTA